VTPPEHETTGQMERRERFRLIYEANYEGILGYALRRTDSAADAHDVVNETFLVAWRRLEDVPGGERARLWLYGTARRTLANHYRGRRRHRRLVAKLQTQPRERDEPAMAGAGPETDGVSRAFSRLSEDDKELLLLVGWEELDSTEVAEVLACKPSTARVRLHRARKRFARELATEGLKQDGTPGHVEGRWATARPDAEEAL